MLGTRAYRSPQIIEGGRVTQVGEGQQAEEISPPATTFGSPAVGEVLAERYELVEHINNDSAGRQVWQGVDVVLRRPVAVVLRYPGGDSAAEMLQAAVAASRVVHPNLVGVYDAIDEEERAYVVREWVDGRSLRELVADGPLDPAHATSIAHSIAGAVSAIHATGMVHGNVHPGTVMVADDGRVVLADARTDGADTAETDVRAIGGVLYYALTGHWPHAESSLYNGSGGQGRAALPDAVRDANGAIAAPRQVRAGVPAYLDDLTMDLLDPQLTVPSSDVLAAELGRLDTAADEQYFDNVGPLRFAVGDDVVRDSSPGRSRRLIIGVAGLVAIALVGLLLGINALGGDDGTGDVAAQVTPSGPAEAGTSGGENGAAPGKPQKVNIAADQVRVIDPDGDRTELDDVEKVVDGDPNDGWETDRYWNRPEFGGKKRGMGILIDLGEPREVTTVQVQLSATGASAQLFTGANAPAESSKNADNQILETYTNRVGEPYEKYDGSTMTFSAFEPDQTYRYLLFWLTYLPEVDPGRYKIGVQEITVQAR